MLPLLAIVLNTLPHDLSSLNTQKLFRKDRHSVGKRSRPFAKEVLINLFPNLPNTTPYNQLLMNSETKNEDLNLIIILQTTQIQLWVIEAIRLLQTQPFEYIYIPRCDPLLGLPDITKTPLPEIYSIKKTTISGTLY